MITPGNISVNESVGEVELCVTSDIPVSTETFVVGETQPKDGTVNQATGELLVSKTFCTSLTKNVMTFYFY